MMEFFAETSVVDGLERSLSESSGVERLDFLVTLAWQLRQRDNARALALADEADALLPSAKLNETEANRTVARLKLVRAEVAWLRAKLDEAESLADTAKAVFEGLGDRIGIGDSMWLISCLLAERGDRAGCEAFILSALDHYRGADDQTRVLMVQARLNFYTSFKDVGTSAADLSRYFDAEKKYCCSIDAWLMTARGSVSRLTGDLGAGVKYSLQAYQASSDSGQTRNAIIQASAVSINLTDLGDLDAALEWNDRALELARQTAWPGLIGICLMQAGKVLRLLGRYEASGAMLKEALDVMGELNASRNYALALRHLGDLAIAVNDYQAALDWFSLLEERALALKEMDLLMPARRGKAGALSWLGRPGDAVHEASLALALARAQKHADEQIQALRVWAQIHRQHELPAPDGMAAPSATLHYLNEAIAVAATISGYSVPGDLFDEASAAYAVLGDYQKAYNSSQAATMARNQARTLDAQNRVIAKQVRYDTERVQAEAEHQTQIAANERERAETLQSINATLETLSQIGKEITASLDGQAVFQVLYRHVHQLLDATTFIVCLMDHEAYSMKGVFGMEDGKSFELPSYRLDDPDSNIARCGREKREIVIDLDSRDAGMNLIPGTLATRSLLYAPLMVGERVLGVISVQSVNKNVYGERERSIFRTLCSYGAIALDNAAAYADLAGANAQIKNNQQQLVASEKMASLGRLTAGIAHEMNTPLAAVRASLDETMHLVNEFDEGIGNPDINDEDNHSIASDMRKSLNLAIKGSERAASFIRSIKNQTRENTSGDKVEFDMLGTTKETLLLMDFALRPKAVEVEFSGAPGPLFIQGIPGRFSQVMTNLLNNAIDALPQKDGRIELIFDGTDTGIGVTIRDNGSGIAPEIQSRIFDPLFTTKRFGEGTGLGLTIVRDIVTGELDGTIDFESEMGKGSSFVLRFRNARQETG